MLQAIILEEKYLRAMAEAYGAERIMRDMRDLEAYKQRVGYEDYIEKIGWNVLPYPEQMDMED